MAVRLPRTWRTDGDAAVSLIGSRPRSVDDLPPRVRVVSVPPSFPHDCNGCGDTLNTATDWWLHVCGISKAARRGERKDRCLL